jgi:hypothetical protein
MATRACPVVVAIGLVAALACVQTVAAQNVRLTVKVRNDADVQTDVLDAAKTAVADIYCKAGIALTFVDGHEDIRVVLLSRHTSGNMHQISDAIGFAPGSQTERGRLAYVLKPRVDRIADGYGVPRQVVLATAISHEIGHLLMFHAHSATGIMRPDWTQSDFRSAVHGKLLFTPEQGAAMRARLVGADATVALSAMPR